MPEQAPVSPTQTLLNGLLEEALTSVKSAKTLVVEHAPDIAQEVLAQRQVELEYEGLIALVLIGCGVVFLAAGVASLAFGIWHDGGGSGWCMSGGIEAIAGLLITGSGIQEFLYTRSQIRQLAAAPKKQVLDYLLHAVGGSKS